MRASLGKRKMDRVFVQEEGHGFVSVLAEEIGFADGGVGEGSIERRRRVGKGVLEYQYVTYLL